MADQRRERGETGRGLSKQKAREQRILDAAAELLQRWGYKKTTIDDIARQARVAKGTIYLHWKTREELFMALIEREQVSLYAEITQRMEEDPEGMTLPGLIKYSMLATLKKPLLKALILQDTDFLGDLVMEHYGKATYQAQVQAYMAMLDFLRKHGVIRSDVDLQEQALTVIAVSWGFLLTEPLLPDDFKFSSDEQMVERVRTTLERILEPDIPPTEEQRRAGKQAFQAYMAQTTELVQQQAQS